MKVASLCMYALVLINTALHFCLCNFCIRWFSIQTKNVHFSLFWGGWKYCQSFVKPDHLLVKCLSLTWKTFASISSEQRIVKLHWDIEYGFFYLKNMIKTTKCQFYSLFSLGVIHIAFTHFSKTSMKIILLH